MNRKQYYTKLDKIWADLVKRPKRCENCGSNYKLEAHHKIHRTYLKGRWKLDNGICLCAECHRKVHDKKLVIKGNEEYKNNGNAYIIGSDELSGIYKKLKEEL